MDTILSQDKDFQEDMPVNPPLERRLEKGKKTSVLSFVFAALAVIAAFLPFVSAFLFWNLLLISAALSVFRFLEMNSKRKWLDNICWMISLAFLFLLFILALDSFKSRQSLFIYGAFSFVVPILLTISALGAKKSAVWKTLSPLIVPAVFIISTILTAAGMFYPALLILPLGWGAFAALNYAESDSR